MAFWQLYRVHRIRFLLGLCPWPRWGNLQCSCRLHSWFNWGVKEGRREGGSGGRRKELCWSLYLYFLRMPLIETQTENNIELRTPPCLTPLLTVNQRGWLLFQTIRVTWHVYSCWINICSTTARIDFEPITDEIVYNSEFCQTLLIRRAPVSYTHLTLPTKRIV